MLRYDSGHCEPRAPRGEHTREVLRELSCSDAEGAELREPNIV